MPFIPHVTLAQLCKKTSTYLCKHMKFKIAKGITNLLVLVIVIVCFYMCFFHARNHHGEHDLGSRYVCVR
jgi:fumarate reductase subunit D